MRGTLLKRPLWRYCLVALAVHCGALQTSPATHAQAESEYQIQQITFGPAHHLFGYIGHAGTIPWSGDGRYILAMRTTFQDHMPTLNEPADILLLDTQDGYRARKVAETRGWNLQQGTMFYWNPAAPNTQFFFNDRDPRGGTLHTVLFDISRGASGQRVKEYRFDDSPVGNSGVAQRGGALLALNYGRLARLRLVTGYAGLPDWSEADNAPENDGVFRIDVETGQRELLVSYRQLREQVRDEFPDIDQYGLFINHTLWNPECDRISFYLRANFHSKLPKVDVPFTMHADGTHLTRHGYRGGHPEWDIGHVMLGAVGDAQVRYHVDSQTVVGTEGPPGLFKNPGGDVALSPDRKWLVNGHKDGGKGMSYFTFLLRETGQVIRTQGIPIGEWVSGDLRIDPAPDWNRTSDQILFGALDPATKTRQLFVLTLRTAEK